MSDLFDAGFTWQEAPTRAAVAKAATVAATVETPGKPALFPQSNPPVASVASVADWRRGLAAFARLPQPSGWSDRAWRVLKADASSLGQLWAEEMIGFGWTIPEIFGWNPKPWTSAVEPCGIVRLLNGRPIGTISHEAVTITQVRGADMTFRRQMPGCTPFDRSSAMPIWLAFSPENLSCAD